MAPTVLLVPGFWGSPSLFEAVASRLHTQGLDADITTLSSTGQLSPSNPSMHDDIAALRSTVEKLVDGERDKKDVVLIVHSCAAFIGSNAIEGGGLYCITPEKLLFDDLDDDAAKQKWIKTLRPQPAEGWNGTVTYCGWWEVQSVYLVSEKDQLIPPPMQEQIAAPAGSKIERCSAGHMAMLSAPDKVAEVIEAAAKLA